MVKVIFKNLEKSEMVSEIVQDKISHVLEKFPELTNVNATISVEMENSPVHAGKDDFRVKLVMTNSRLRPVVIQKAGTNLYQAAAILADRLFEVLHRSLEKRRDQRRYKHLIPCHHALPK